MRVNNMTAISIDLDMLDELLDNQKKLDNIFNSIFEDDSFLSTTPSTSHARRNSTQQSRQVLNDNEDFSFNTQDKAYTQTSRGLAHIAIPVVLEIAVICYGIMYFA